MTAAQLLLLAAIGVHRIDEGNHIFYGRLGKDTMPQIEDMAFCGIAFPQDVFHPVFYLFLREKKGARVKVPLNNYFLAEFLDRIRKVDSPVYPDNVCPDFLISPRRPAQLFTKYIIGTPSFFNSEIAFLT